MIPDPDYSDDENLNSSKLNNFNKNLSSIISKNKCSPTHSPQPTTVNPAPSVTSANMVARNNRVNR